MKVKVLLCVLVVERRAKMIIPADVRDAPGIISQIKARQMGYT